MDKLLRPEPAARQPYRGRFAPSPTGPLHLGSLVAAVGSYLDARAQGGQWLVRIEDVDTTRCLPGVDEAILRTLEAFAFEWDGPVIRQSRRGERYRAVLDSLRAAGCAYPCTCTRREIAARALAQAIDGGPRYPGTCRNRCHPERRERAWRLRVPAGRFTVDDRLQGRLDYDLAVDSGDFVLHRADGCAAYQLAVTVDDHDQGITHIVRGHDLVASTPRQAWLRRCLDWAEPAHAHLPVLTNAAGEKLSKQTQAPPLDPGQPAPQLCAALRFLGQAPPAHLADAPLSEVWAWAKENWSFAAIPRIHGQPLQK